MYDNRATAQTRRYAETVALYKAKAERDARNNALARKACKLLVFVVLPAMILWAKFA